MKLLQELKLVDNYEYAVDEFSLPRPYSFLITEDKDYEPEFEEPKRLKSYTLEALLRVEFKAIPEGLNSAIETAKNILVTRMYQEILCEIAELDKLAFHGGTRKELLEITNRIRKKIMR